MHRKPQLILDVFDMALGDFLFPHAELKLVIAQTFEADVESAKNILSKEFLETAARVRLSKGNLQRLGLKDGAHASVKSKAGTIVIAAYEDEKVPESSAVIPYGPWALALVPVPKEEAPPQMHGISVTVTKSDDDITSLDQLLEHS
ncbi:MAG: molybdopterin dinucleotide binding domain-containing protein [Candidatus Thorarchaeota archaeon]